MMISLSRLRWPAPNSTALAPIALTIALLLSCAASLVSSEYNKAEAQTAQSQALTLRSDIQEANAKTGVVTARGNVQINYPARQIQATSAQAQYFSRERRIVLSGNVYVLQQGNSLRGETVTYLIDEGRFVALPQTSKQVEAIYLVPDTTTPTATSTPTSSPFGKQPEFAPTQVSPEKSPTSIQR